MQAQDHWSNIRCQSNDNNNNNDVNNIDNDLCYNNVKDNNIDKLIL